METRLIEFELYCAHLHHVLRTTSSRVHSAETQTHTRTHNDNENCQTDDNCNSIDAHVFHFILCFFFCATFSSLSFAFLFSHYFCFSRIGSRRSSQQPTAQSIPNENDDLPKSVMWWVNKKAAIDAGLTYRMYDVPHLLSASLSNNK